MMCHGKEKVKNKIKEYELKGNNMTQKEKNTLTILEVANEMYARGIKFCPLTSINPMPLSLRLKKTDSDRL